MEEFGETLQAQRIVLTGFMGSGKTTIGQLLAQRCGWAFVDLDTEVEARCGASVPQLFAEQGEEYFRKAEASALQNLLKRTQTIIALGGGAPETAQVRELLANSLDTATIYLDAPFTMLCERCAEQALQPNATARPLLANLELAEERFLRRQPHYEAISTIRFESAGQSPAQIAEALLQRLS